MDRLTDSRISVSFTKETKHLYPCERCQIKGRHLDSCSHVPQRSCSAKFIGLIRVINTPETNEEFLRRVSDD